jgi:carboxyl-terminal processing protease
MVEKNLLSRWVALLLLGLASFSPNMADAQNRFALVIGNDKYDHLGPDAQLRRAVNDARSVRQTLESLGFKVTLGENVERSTFNRLWQSFLDEVTPGDTAAFYYSGHGVEIEGQNFLLPSDLPNVGGGRREQLRRESLSVTELLLDLKSRAPQVTLIVLDACRDDPFTPPGLRGISGKGGLAGVKDPPEGTFIMYSAGAGETALDRLPANDPDPTNSVYTRHLIPLFKTAGLTLPDLARQLRERVYRVAASVPHAQRPAYYDGLMGHYCLAGCELAVPQPKPSVALSAALLSAPEAGQRPKVAALIGDKESRSSIDLLGEIIDKIREKYVEQPSDRALMSSAIEGMLRKFGNDEARIAADRGLAAPSKTKSGNEPAQYALLDVFGDVLERILQDQTGAESRQMILRESIDGMLSGLDPLSAYFDAAAYKKQNERTFGAFGGLGIELKKEKEKLRIVLPLEGGPAARAGVAVNDLITHINGESTEHLTLQQVVDKLRGPVNTVVAVTLLREGQPAPLGLTIIRETIRVNTVKFSSERDGLVGYIKITAFNSQTQKGVVQAVKSLRQLGDEKIKGYILDLRNNTGGVLDQVFAVADGFLDKGLIATVKGRNLEETGRATARSGDMLNGKPLVLLINDVTASGAEIVAGALKDNNRAKIVGVRSAGVASVQTIFPMRDKSGLRLTTSRFYTPNGQSIQGKGIQPDIKVDRPANNDPDVQLQKAIELLIAN